jgi:hypothetical protein
MFDESDCATAIDFIFGDGTLPSIGSEIQSHGGTVTQGECAECDGTLYEYEHEVVCGNCSIVVGADTNTQSTTRWAEFNNDRPTYYNSNKPRCVGGFPDTYDWVKREDIDHPVRQLDPNKFYSG